MQHKFKGYNIWPLFLIGHLCLSSLWQGLRLGTNTKMTMVIVRLDYVLEI